MGLIEKGVDVLFGGGRNVIAETAEVFRANADKADARAADLQGAALREFAAEFARQRGSGFDRVIDGINRLPRPALAFGTLGLFVAAMVDPVWFAARMQGIALVPEPLWWLMGAIVSFYFGARHQAKGQEFQRSIAASLAATPQVLANTRALMALDAGAASLGEGGPEAAPDAAQAPLPLTPARPRTGPNAALEDWRAGR